MAAIHATLLSLVSAGDRILCTQFVYGTTRSLLVSVLGRLGVRVDFVDTTDAAAVEAALAAAPTRVLYLETIANPTILVADIAALSAMAHRHGATVVVDNTFASPYLCRPLELGADLVVESATKYLSGHSDVLAGIVAGSRERIAAIRKVQTDTGATLAPFSSFLVLRGLPTLAIRMERHAETAGMLAAFLEGRPGVERVYYPSLASHPQHDVAARQFPLGGGMLAFELEGGSDGRRAPGGDGVHRCPDDPRPDGVAGQHPHDRRPPASHHPPPARRRRAPRGGDLTGAAPLLRGAGGRRRSRGRFLRGSHRRPAGSRRGSLGRLTLPSPHPTGRGPSPARRPARSLRSPPQPSNGRPSGPPLRTRSPGSGWRSGIC